MEQTSELNVAIQHLSRLLEQKQFQLAEKQGKEILRVVPDEPNALFATGAALRNQGKLEEATEILEKTVNKFPNFPLAHQELGLVYCNTNQFPKAIDCFRQAVSLEPNLPVCWKILSDLLLSTGNVQEYNKAYQGFMLAVIADPQIKQALHYKINNHNHEAEKLCREALHKNPDNIEAMRLIAELAKDTKAYHDANKLLLRCLEINPGYHLARLNRVSVLAELNQFHEALENIEQLISLEPNTYAHQILKASILMKMGDVEQAASEYERLTALLPNLANLQINKGHALKTLGRVDESITAYRKSIELSPNIGNAYWSLANLKTFKFDQSEIKSMWDLLTTTESTSNLLTDDDRVSLCFALGKGLDDQKLHDDAFKMYHQGNQLKHKLLSKSASETVNNISKLSERIIETCDNEFFSADSDYGSDKADPIFIVGLPRSGSTLLEQILASHSMVDGTKELPDILAMVRELSGKKKASDTSKYPQILTELSAENLKQLGEEYLSRTRGHRKGAPFFIDKMPNNFIHSGLIKKILPNAKIIDIRRSPMATGFSCYKQLFASGQNWTYSLEDIGNYYVNYVRLMEHWHSLDRSIALTVHYEDLVNNLEKEVRKILDYCALPFEEACLEFYKTKRAIHTVSAEQVRQPINKSGIDAWKPYEKDLKPLYDIVKDHM